MPASQGVGWSGCSRRGAVTMEGRGCGTPRLPTCTPLKTGAAPLSLSGDQCFVALRPPQRLLTGKCGCLRPGGAPRACRRLCRKTPGHPTAGTRGHSAREPARLRGCEAGLGSGPRLRPRHVPPLTPPHAGPRPDSARPILAAGALRSGARAQGRRSRGGASVVTAASASAVLCIPHPTPRNPRSGRPGCEPVSLPAAEDGPE